MWKNFGLALLVVVAVGVVASSVTAQSAVRMWATLASNLTTGVSTPVTCTASGAGCYLDVQIAGGAGTLSTLNGPAGAPLAITADTGQSVNIGNVSGNGLNVGSTGITIANRILLLPPASGVLNIANQTNTNGSQIKVDALPTVGSGFGTSPSVTAGSTPFAGSVNVGTGGTATSGVITFGGAAYPSNPFCTANVVTTTAGNVRAMGVSASTTALTLTAASAWVASDVVSWHCISSK